MPANSHVLAALTHLAAAVAALAKQRATDDETRTAVFAHVDQAMRETEQAGNGAA